MSTSNEKEVVLDSILKGISYFRGMSKEEASFEGIAECGVGDVNEFLTKLYSVPSISLNFALFLLKLLTPFSTYPLQDLMVYYNEDKCQYELIVLGKSIMITTEE